MRKSQTSLEFIMLASIIVIVAIFFGVLYYTTTQKTLNTTTLNDPSFITNFYPINQSQSVLLTNNKIYSKTLSISYLFNISDQHIAETIKYNIASSNENEYGTLTYIINTNGSYSYYPSSSNYTLCSVSYENTSGAYSVPTNEC